MRTSAVVSAVAAAAAFLAGIAAPSAASPKEHDHVPSIARRWAAAWVTTDTGDLARLYTRDAVYTDRALGLVFRGRAGVTEWETGSHQLIGDFGYEVTGGFRAGDEAVIEGVFSGHIVGAPRPFAVPSVTLLRLRGNLIRSSDDYYNRGEILSDSGLPADWTPPGN